MNDTFMKEKPILPLLTSMALPMVISMLVNSLYNIVDSFFVAQINEQAMAALSLVFPVQNFVNATAIGFGVGINAMIAFHLGAGNKENANASATHGMILSVIHGFLALIISIAIMPTFLGAFTKDKNVIKLGLEYSRIVFLFAPVIMISLAFEKIFQAVGRMNETMFALLCGCISNIILDPLLIFGIGFFPKLGIKGAALATGIGQIITVIVYLIYYVKKPLPVKLKKSCLPLQRSLDFRLYTIGVPAILNLALPSFLVSFLNGVLSAYSDIYVVVLGIYYKLQTFLYLPASGIVQGMRPVIGYNYGAGEMDRVRKIFRLALLMCGGIMAGGTLLCLFFANGLIGMFTTNPETIQAGGLALRIISSGFIVSSISVTASGALEGLGKGVQSLLISLMRYVVIIMPAVFILSRIRGAVGVWNAFWITELISAIASVWIYRKSLKH